MLQKAFHTKPTPLRWLLKQDTKCLVLIRFQYDYRSNDICAKYQRGQTKDYNGIVTLCEKRRNDCLGVSSPSIIAAALKETDDIIGEIVVMPDEGTISLGYTFSYKIHRQGYAYEALSALMDYLHERFPDWDFVWFTDPQNVASMELLKKIGYVDRGYLPSKDSQVFGKWLRKDTNEEISQAVR